MHALTKVGFFVSSVIIALRGSAYKPRINLVSISHYQSAVFDDSDGIGKVVTNVIIDCGIVFCVVW